MSEPTKRDRTRPAELVGISGVIALAIGIITYFATKNLLFSVEVLGVVFIVTLVVFAMLLLAVTPRGGDRDDEPPSPH